MQKTITKKSSTHTSKPADWSVSFFLSFFFLSKPNVRVVQADLWAVDLQCNFTIVSCAVDTNAAFKMLTKVTLLRSKRRLCAIWDASCDSFSFRQSLMVFFSLVFSFCFGAIFCAKWIFCAGANSSKANYDVAVVRRVHLTTSFGVLKKQSDMREHEEKKYTQIINRSKSGVWVCACDVQIRTEIPVRLFRRDDVHDDGGRTKKKCLCVLFCGKKTEWTNINDHKAKTRGGERERKKN